MYAYPYLLILIGIGLIVLSFLLLHQNGAFNIVKLIQDVVPFAIGAIFLLVGMLWGILMI